MDDKKLLTPCCEDFGRFYHGDPQEPNIRIYRSVKEPPHYDPPRYFILHCRVSDEGGYSVRICFCPFCGDDLNELWRRNLGQP